MWKEITDRKDYVTHMKVTDYPFEYSGRLNKVINGKEISIKDSFWGNHLHIKVSNDCNAKCKFCVEQASKVKTSKNLIINVDKMLRELQDQGILHTVSVTGGEPTIYPYFKELCEVLRKYDIPFLTMNTNGYKLEEKIDLIDGLFDFVDISRHAIDEDENRKIFDTNNVPTLNDLKRIKSKLKKTKMRIQCVCCSDMSVDKFYKMVEAYNFADNMSFRRLMVLNDEYKVNYENESKHLDIYYQILDDVVKNHKFENQTIQDYYVYEDWNVNGMTVDFSYSDMKKVREIEELEDDKIYREFIAHPDGKITGSWNPFKKVLIDIPTWLDINSFKGISKIKTVDKNYNVYFYEVIDDDTVKCITDGNIRKLDGLQKYVKDGNWIDEKILSIE